MSYMFQALAVIVCFMVGLAAGRWCGRTKGWWAAFAGSMLVVGVVIVGHRSMGLSVVAPFSWAIDAHVTPQLMALAIPLMLSVLIVRLKERRKRVAASVAMGAMLAAYCVLPVVMPMAARGSLLAGRTVVDRHGVCLQTHGFTCGPASAVTCLGMLGAAGEEGRLGAEAESGPVVGTDPVLLEHAINRVYGAAGVRCRYRVADKLDAVRTPFVATMWIPHVGGHYVAVLSVGKDFVMVGDPLSGEDKWVRLEFERAWKGGAHEIWREGQQ
jgi:hypothetical protein